MSDTTNPNPESTLAKNITSTYGKRGSQWLASLPTIIKTCAQKWNLRALHPYPNLTYNYVMSGMMHDTPIVLKLRCDAVELRQEIAAIQAYDNYGFVKVLKYDLDLGAVILERAQPGTPLTTLFPDDDEHATRIAANCIQQLHQAPIKNKNQFTQLKQILPELTHTSTALDPFIAHAQTLKNQLLSTQQKKVLLHGDFHHDNILSASNNAWVVIDPKGVVGDPVYDLTVFIRNPITQLSTHSHASTIISTRINIFAKLLGYDAQRIYDWTYLQTVVSAYWSIKDRLDISRHITFLEYLKNIHH